MSKARLVITAVVHRIGRRCARTPVLMIINDLNIRIINPTTGELLRQLTLNPDRDYQPQPRT